MSKKKLLSLVFIAVFVLYLASGGIIFFLAREIEYRNFTQASEAYSDTLLRLIKKDDPLNDPLNDLRMVIPGSPAYPTVFCLNDKDGNAIVKSEPVLVVENYDFKTDESEFIKIPLDPILTEETRAALREISNPDHSEILILSRLSLRKDGDDHIPVEAVIYNGLDESEYRIVRFTEGEADLVLTEDKGLTMRIYGFQDYGDRTRRETVARLYGYLEDHLKNFRLTHSQFNGDGSAFSAAGILQEEYEIEVDGQQYYYYFDARSDVTRDTFHSAIFRGTFGYISIVFLPLTAALLFILSKLYDKNRRLDRSREAFVAAAAHELKTPLAVIANRCECILENVSPERNTEYVSAVYDESKRMSRMVKTLLQYNSLRTQTKIKKKPEELSEILSEQAEKYLPLIEAKDIAYTAQTQPVQLSCSRELLAIAIDNLLSNAVKFTPEGGTIRAEITKEGRKIRFSLNNSGSGISPEDAPHIWEELYSGDKARTRTDGSAGMGLAICRRVFELHGFRFGFLNEGDGVSFRFEEK